MPTTDSWQGGPERQGYDRNSHSPAFLLFCAADAGTALEGAFVLDSGWSSRCGKRTVRVTAS